MTLKVDVEFQQGATFQREYTVVNKLTGEAVDFPGLGYTGEGMIIENATNVKVADMAVTLGLGTVSVEVDGDTLALLPATTHYAHRYVVKAVHPTRPDYRIAQGNGIISIE